MIYCLGDVGNPKLTNAFRDYMSQDDWVQYFNSNVANIKKESYATISQYLFILSNIQNTKLNTELSETKTDLQQVLQTEKVQVATYKKSPNRS